MTCDASVASVYVSPTLGAPRGSASCRLVEETTWGSFVHPPEASEPEAQWSVAFSLQQVGEQVAVAHAIEEKARPRGAQAPGHGHPASPSPRQEQQRWGGDQAAVPSSPTCLALSGALNAGLIGFSKLLREGCTRRLHFTDEETEA